MTAGAPESALRPLNLRLVNITPVLPGHPEHDRLVFDLECSGAFPDLNVERLALDAALPEPDDPRWRDRGCVRPTGPRPIDHRLWVRRSVLDDESWLAFRQVAERCERRHMTFRMRDRVLRLDCRRPRLMGVVNVTPDSFSDGGHFLDPTDAVAQGERLAAAGAELLDVGGESTRPGSEFVSEEQELSRVVPVIEQLVRNTDATLSVDTRKSAVAAAAIEVGACIVNDTSALEDDPEIAGVVARTGAGVILMHRQGIPRTMQEAPQYLHCRAEVTASLGDSAARALEAGIASDHIMVDPGIGFGKRLQDNLDLLHHLGELRSLGFPVLLGASRKTFLGKITGRDVGDREAATLATTAVAYQQGAHVIRVHDVQASSDLLQVLATRDDG